MPRILDTEAALSETGVFKCFPHISSDTKGARLEKLKLHHPFILQYKKERPGHPQSAYCEVRDDVVSILKKKKYFY